jgi:hypothetical protein
MGKRKNLSKNESTTYDDNKGRAITGVEDFKANGGNGCLLIADTNAKTGVFRCIVPQTTTVFNKVYQKMLATPTMTHIEKTDLSAATSYAPAFISAGAGDEEIWYFDSIQLTSGSVLAYYY